MSEHGPRVFILISWHESSIIHEKIFRYRIIMLVLYVNSDEWTNIEFHFLKNFLTKQNDGPGELLLGMATDDSCRDLNSKSMSTVMTLSSRSTSVDHHLFYSFCLLICWRTFRKTIKSFVSIPCWISSNRMDLSQSIVSNDDHSFGYGSVRCRSSGISSKTSLSRGIITIQLSNSNLKQLVRKFRSYVRSISFSFLL